jgi:hypothetical protein
MVTPLASRRMALLNVASSADIALPFLLETIGYTNSFVYYAFLSETPA